MRLIDNQNITDPAINLALEEHCYRNLDSGSEYVLFYINEPSVIIGNHQNPFQEVNAGLAARRQIRPIRRISGGGAVYHDPGNLNFSFITDFGEEKLDYFKKLLQPVIDTLNRLGVPAELGEKNNINVRGKKISGNSQHANLRRLVSHGTLLFNADLDTLRRVLQSKLQIIRSRAVQSIPSSVTNISDCLPRPMKLAAFMAELTAAISRRFGEMEHFRLTSAEWDAVYRLADEKYRSWQWNMGRTPEFTARHRCRSGNGEIELIITVKRGIIQNIRLPADSPDSADPAPFLDELVGRRFGSDEFGNTVLSKA